MGFIIHTVDYGLTRPFEEKPAGAGLALTVGTALTMTAGKLAIASGTTAPTYISMTQRTATTDGEKIAVIRADKGVVYETTLSEAFTAIAPGAKATISTDGGSITSTTTGGVAEIVNFDGTAAGDKVRVRF